MDYAVRALLELALAGRGEYLSSSDIAQRQNIPLRYLRRILSKLISEGVLAAREGAGGGVCLARKCADISVLDLTDMFQGGIELSDCMYRRQPCENRDSCPLRRRIMKVQTSLTAELNAITIADLLDDIKAGK